MSRVGKNPVPIPKGVTASLSGQQLTVKGPKGTLERDLSGIIDIEVNQEAIVLKRRDDSRRARAQHGLMRALVNNMVVGVSAGYSKVLEIHGIGYRADVQKDVVTLSLGFSHPVEFKLPAGISASVEKQTVVRLEGIDKELLGQTAADMKALRPCEPYKGKGIRYAGEEIRRKAGKAGIKK